MKRYFLLFGLMNAALFLHSQQITGREYFIDTDPGTGHGTSLSFAAADSITETVNIQTATLTTGFHRAYFRYRYNNGSWGNTYSTLFFITDTSAPVINIAASIAGGEYFIDTDPGTGHATTFTASGTDSTLDNLSVATGSLSSGFHRVYARYKNQSGYWGNTFSTLFFVIDTSHPVLNNSPIITRGEYFVDTDPGTGNGTRITGLVSGDSVMPVINIATAGLTTGAHTAFVRFADLSGHWGQAVPVAFTICNSPTEISAQPQPKTVCDGDSTTFSVTASGQGISYQWQFNGNNLAFDTLASLTISNAASADSGNYRVVVTGTCGSDTSSAAVLNVTGNPVINMQPATQTECAGDSAVFSVTASGQGLTYQWQKDGNSITGQTSARLVLINVSFADTGSYSVIVSNTCHGTVSHNALLVLVSGTTITAQPQNQNTCTGGSASFTVSVASASPTYQWQHNGVNIPSATAATYSITAAQNSDTGNYSVVITGGCGNPVSSQAVLLTLAYTVTVNVTPDGNIAVCQGDSTQLTASGIAGLNYNWSDGTRVAATYAAQTGNYIVTATAPNNCSAAAAPVVVTVNPLPAVPSVTRNGDSLFSSPANSYQWLLNSSAINNGNQQSIIITENGEYQVQVTDSNGCTNISAALNITNSGINQITGLEHVKVYPNPNSGIFAIQFEHDALRQIVINDALGNTVLRETVSSNKESFNLSNCAGGIYFIRINENGQNIVIKTDISR